MFDRRVLILAAALAAPAFAAPSLARAAPVLGQAAPAFTAVDASGKARSLADFRGRTVVLEWTNNGCPYVQKHYNSGNMQGLQKQATADGVVLPGGKWRIEFAPGQPRPAVGIALESVANAAAGWQVSLDSDANGATRQATGAGSDRGAAIARSIDLDDAGKGTAPW